MVETRSFLLSVVLIRFELNMDDCGVLMLPACIGFPPASVHRVDVFPFSVLELHFVALAIISAHGVS